jgi:hypothetical protein
MMINGNANDFDTVKADLVNKAWTDDAFRAQLTANPREVLSAYGAQIPPGVDIEVMEDGSDKWHFVLPAAPEEGEISDSDLMGANGGTTKCCVSGMIITLISKITK